jgi:hypothetical protein
MSQNHRCDAPAINPTQKSSLFEVPFRLEWNCLATIHDSQRNLARPCILSRFSNGGAQITGMRANRLLKNTS